MRSTVKRGRMTPILANTITADMGLIPGLALAGPALGLPLSVFAAFLERPFISLAGVCSDAIWYSLQANFVSLLIGYVGLIAAAVMMTALIRNWRQSAEFLILAPTIEVAQKQGQLDNTQLTLRDLSMITDVFVNILRGTHHPRISYPKESPATQDVSTVPNKK